jgi:hypothetical protein
LPERLRGRGGTSVDSADIDNTAAIRDRRRR